MKPSFKFAVEHRAAALVVMNILLFVWLAGSVVANPRSYDFGHPYARHVWQIGIAVSNYYQRCCGHYVGSQAVLSSFVDLTAANPERVRFQASNHEQFNQILAEAKSKIADPKGLRFVNFMGDLGYTDYFMLAFLLFGPSVQAFVYLFVALLAIPLVLLLWQFRRDQVVLRTSLFVLAGITARIAWLGADGDTASVYNSRVLEILGVLPALHLTASVWRGDRSWPALVTNAVQALILVLVIYARGSAAVLMLLPMGAALLRLGLWIRHDVRGHAGRIGVRGMALQLRHLSAVWWLVIFVSFKSIYPSLVLDPYTLGHSGHHVWHEIYKGFLWGDPAWSAYGVLDNDGGAKQAADAWLKTNLNVSVKDVQESPKGMALYEDALRHVVIQLAVNHPGLTLSTFLISKPTKYVKETFSFSRGIWQAFLLSPALLLALIAAFLAPFRSVPGSAAFLFGFILAGFACGLSLIVLVYYTAHSAGLAVAFECALLYALIAWLAERFVFHRAKSPP